MNAKNQELYFAPPNIRQHHNNFVAQETCGAGFVHPCAGVPNTWKIFYKWNIYLNFISDRV